MKCWKAVGAIPPTQACLKSPKVCHEVGDSSPEDKMQILMTEIQNANTIACDLLTVRGFDGSMLRAHLKKKQKIEKRAEVTVPISQERLDALAKAATHGAHFAATGGQHFTSDDVIQAAEIPVRKEQIKKWKRAKRKGLQVLHSWVKQRKFWKLVSRLLE